MTQLRRWTNYVENVGREVGGTEELSASLGLSKHVAPKC